MTVRYDDGDVNNYGEGSHFSLENLKERIHQARLLREKYPYTVLIERDDDKHYLLTPSLREDVREFLPYVHTHTHTHTQTQTPFHSGMCTHTSIQVGAHTHTHTHTVVRYTFVSLSHTHTHRVVRGVAIKKHQTL